MIERGETEREETDTEADEQTIDSSQMTGARASDWGDLASGAELEKAGIRR